MENPIAIVDWVEKDEIVDYLLEQLHTLTIHPMAQGFEAEVMKICSHTESFVLKVWNKNSNPDIGFQYQLLKVLYDQGISVSKPIGWGINLSGDKVLLTTFDGTPVVKANQQKISGIARILSEIHQINVDELTHIRLPTAQV